MEVEVDAFWGELGRESCGGVGLDWVCVLLVHWNWVWRNKEEEEEEVHVMLMV